jgi:MerR family redox-sensitive transcriptional activator SoxR
MPERDPVATIRGELQIGQVARQTGHTAVTLRHWEKTGLLDPPPRRGGKRRYPPSVLTHIALIDLARQAGFSLAEIRELLTAPDPGLPAADCWRALVTRKLAETDSLMACLRDRQRLLEDLLACHCPRLEDCAMHISHAETARGLKGRAARPDRASGGPEGYAQELPAAACC